MLLFSYAIDDEPVECIDLTQEALPDEVLSMLHDPNYIKMAYSRAAVLYNDASDQGQRDQLVTIRHDFAAFDTGLLTSQYEPIIAYFARNTRPGERRWYFRGWATPGSPMLARATGWQLAPWLAITLKGRHENG